MITHLEPYVVGAADFARHADTITPTRLPLWTRPQHPNRVIDAVARCPVGVRLRLRTASSRVTVGARVEQNVDWSQPEPALPPIWIATTGVGASRRELARVAVAHPDILRDEPDGRQTLHPGDGAAATFDLGAAPDGVARTVELWLPHNARVDLRSIDADAPIEPAPMTQMTRWLHYGSSISQCGNAADPLSSWPAQVAHGLEVDLTSMALSGNAMLDPFVARAIAESRADVISLKLGINVVNAAALTARTFGPSVHGFLDIIRSAHPAVPIVVITAIACPIHETTPGPTVWGSADGRLHGTTSAVPREGEMTLQDTRRLMREVVKTRRVSDSNLHLLDGLALLASEDSALLYDDLHPGQDGFDLMAERFIALVRSRDDLSEAFRQRPPAGTPT